MAVASSMSHHVCIGTDVVVKLVDAAGRTRLDREVALASAMPAGLGAPLLASGRFLWETCAIRFACFARLPGASPVPGLPGVGAVTARRWGEQAVRRLNELHQWRPSGDIEQALKESPAHEGFVGRAALIDDIERIAAAGCDAIVPRSLLDGLRAVARRAPLRARADVPVHADCDWGNWLVQDESVTALLDFERARLGDPADDWVLLAATSGIHLDMVLNLIADATMTGLEELRADCELRSAAFIAEDLRTALEQPDAPAWTAKRVRDLEMLVVGRRWWAHNR